MVELHRQGSAPEAWDFFFFASGISMQCRVVQCSAMQLTAVCCRMEFVSDLEEFRLESLDQLGVDLEGVEDVLVGVQHGDGRHGAPLARLQQVLGWVLS